MLKQKVLGVIPARLGSTRLKEKLLLDFHGKPLVIRTLEAAAKAKMLDGLVVATDTKAIADAVKVAGGKFIMTSEKIQSGSDRTAAAARLFKDFKPDIVVNIQGDEPLIPIRAIDDTVKALIKDKSAVMATPASVFKDEQDVLNPNFVKVVTTLAGKALYFSRSQLPYPRDNYTGYLKHLGLYAYRYDFLQKYPKLKQTPLELAEKLEQLRVLENGYHIIVVKGNYPTMEVNTLEEYKLALRLFIKNQNEASA